MSECNIFSFCWYGSVGTTNDKFCCFPLQFFHWSGKALVFHFIGSLSTFHHHTRGQLQEAAKVQLLIKNLSNVQLKKSHKPMESIEGLNCQHSSIQSFKYKLWQGVGEEAVAVWLGVINSRALPVQRTLELSNRLRWLK